MDQPGCRVFDTRFFQLIEAFFTDQRSVILRQILFFQCAGQIDEIAGGLPAGFAAAQPMAGGGFQK